MRQRGFGLAQLAVAGVVLGLVAAGLWYVDHRGYERGRAQTLAEWGRANEDAEKARRAREKAVALELVKLEKARLAADQIAKGNHDKWREAVRAASRSKVALGVCPEPKPRQDGGAHGMPPASGPAALDATAGDPVDRGIRLTWQFVRDFDTAWTGGSGESLSPLAAWSQGPAAAGAASPYGLADVRDVQGENARRCSEDRREHAGLIADLEAAATRFDEAAR